MAIATYYLLMACVVLIPTTSGLWSSLHIYDEKRLIQAALISLILINLLIDKRATEQVQQILGGFGKAFLLIAGGMWICSMAAPNLTMGILETSWLIALALCSLWLAACIETHKLHQITLKLLAAAVILYELFTVMDLAIGYALGLTFDQMGLPGFANRRFCNQWQTWTLPLIGAAPWFFNPSRKSAKIGCWIVAIIWWAIAFLVAARGTLLSLLIAMAIVATVYGHRAWAWLKNILLSAFAGALAAGAYANSFGSLWAGFASLQDHASGGIFRLTDGAGLHRLQSYQLALNAALDNWWFGIGPMHYAQLPGDIANHPHNAPLQILSEYGLLIGTAIIAFPLTLLIRWIIQQRIVTETKDEKIGIVVTGTLIAATSHAQLSGVHVMPYSQLLLVIWVGLAIAAYRNQTTRRVAPVGLFTPLRGIIMACLGGIGIGILSTFLDPSLPAPLTQHDPDTSLWPRFWIQGKF